MQLDELIGQPIIGVYLSDDKNYIKLATPSGDLVLMAYGDCCSTSWIEDASLFGKLGTVTKLEGFEWNQRYKVVNAEDNSPADDSQSFGYDVLKFYRSVIHMEQGYLEIEYRNTSNGFYGGELIIHGEFRFEHPSPETTWKEVS